MKVITEIFTEATRGNSEILDITHKATSFLAKHQLREGILTVFVAGSTASVTTTEFEPGLRKDIPDALERVAPRDQPYHHDQTWHDGNGHSHVRAALVGPSLTIPFRDGNLVLGTWQQLVLIDHDNRPRDRDIVLQLIGQ